MARRSFLTCTWLLLWSLIATTANAAGDVDLEQLRGVVKQHVVTHYQARLGTEALEQRLAVEVGTLDPRLRLGQCAQPLTLTVKEPPQGHGNLTVKTACERGQRWTIYVPVRVDLYAEVAVASRSLGRGHVIEAGDVRLERTNLSQLGAGHIEDATRAVGMELRRPMEPGEAFRLPNMDQPQVVKRGDSVVVEAQAGALTVVAPGRALGNGTIGSQIRVENTQSKRVIDAQIVGPGRVKVLL